MQRLAHLHNSLAMKLSVTFLLFITTYPLCYLAFSFQTVTNARTDHLALLSFKTLITDDPSGVLNSWGNASTVSYCQWHGVTCGARGQRRGRVTTLELPGLNLSGTISPAISNLSFLKSLHLPKNQLHGPVPHEFSLLLNLKHLDLSFNFLNGEVPPSLSRCSNLRNISLGFNNLQGGIPEELGSLVGLQSLSLLQNTLTGSIPADSFQNLQKLEQLSLDGNKLSGIIPPSLGNLTSLTYLLLNNNSLTGMIPTSLGALSSLTELGLMGNNLTGGIPPSLGNLSSLLWLDIGYNYLTGTIHISLGNLYSLTILEISENLYSLHGLFRLELGVNQLEARRPADWNFLTALANCSILSLLVVSENNLGGVLPSSLANLSTSLRMLYINYNTIEGTVPDGIGNLVGLTRIAMGGNLLHGTIPVSLGRLNMLQDIEIELNSLEGSIPTSLGNLTLLNHLRLADNLLSGNIPSSLANCRLNWLDLEGNKLTGPVPKEILEMPTLSVFLDLQDNMLSGPLPSEVGSLKNLQRLDISNNRIYGEIPESLGECVLLGYLNMSMNLFEGSIPSSLSNLRGLQMLDLSYNHLSGHVPEFLGSLTGIYLNLSFNDLEGEVPKQGIFQNHSAFSITGNNRLCGGILELRLPPCPNKVSQKHHSPKLKIILAPIAAIFCCMVLFSLLAFRFGSTSLRKSPTSMILMNEYPRVSYGELARATEGFSPVNLIGVGSFGSVYKGMINYEGQATAVAIKVINIQQHGASQSFAAECEALRHARHRNLVKILTVCSGLDSGGNDFKALIYEFLPNGNLDERLHNPSRGNGEQAILDINQRLGTAIDVASALDYLHHHKPLPIVHCDLKPSNILLDNDLVAHVVDFGLARFLCDDANSSQNSTSWGALRGTIGYIAPEYGIGNEVSTYGDIFSYGILLLELFTAKRPTDDAFKGGLSLHQYVEMALPHKTIEIIDQSLFLTGLNGANRPDITNRAERDITCITSVLRVGIQCSKEEPTERMQITDALREMHRIRENMNRPL